MKMYRFLLGFDILAFVVLLFFFATGLETATNDDYVTVHASGGERFDVELTMAALEGRLDPATFLRIHRRFIVNMDHVASIVPIDGSRFEAKMRDGTVLAVSRQRSRILRERGC